MSLQEWLNLYSRRPLMIALALVLVLLGLQVAKDFSEQRNYQDQAALQTADMIALSITQKNRELVEALLDASQWQLRTVSSMLCLNGRPILSSSQGRFDCVTSELPLGYRQLKKSIPGFRGHELSLILPVFSFQSSYIFYIALGFLVLAAMIMLTRYFQNRLENDLINPLQNNLLQGIALPIRELEELRQQQRRSTEAKIEAAVAAAVFEKSRQVAHDIRSPLSALNMVVTSLSNLSDERKNILLKVSHRINDIANSLLNVRSVEPIDAAQPVLLSPLVDSIVSEKRYQYRNLKIKIESQLFEGQLAIATIHRTEFARALSNLINNAVESLSNSEGTVNVFLKAGDPFHSLVVSDNGRGIPQKIINLIGQKHFSFGPKKSGSGSGLGLFYAKKMMESIGGSLSIDSVPGQGTQVLLLVPKCPKPSWLVSELNLKPGQTVVTIDDDPSIHEIWDDRLKEICEINRIRLHSLDQLRNFAKTAADQEIIYLVDFNFEGESANGWQVCIELGLAKDCIVVTANYEEALKHSRGGAQLLPKQHIEFLEIKS